MYIYIEKFRKKAEKVFKQYINLAKESTKEMNFMLGDMQFLSGNKPYEKIHKKCINHYSICLIK